MNNCKNNELIAKAKEELDLLESKEIQQAYRDANLIPPIIVGNSERNERAILLGITRERIETNENLAYSIHSIAMQKRNDNNMEKILMDERIKGRSAKVKEYLGKLSTQEIVDILRKSDKVIGIPSARYFSSELLYNIAYQTCLIDMKTLVNFEMAITEKFERAIEENAKKHFTVYPKKTDKDNKEMKKEMNEKYTDNIKDIIRYMTRDNYKNIEVDELKDSESDKKLKEDLDRLGKLFNVKCHENFVNTMQEKLNERTTTIDEDFADNILETYVTEMVTKNKYFDEELREHLNKCMFDVPYNEVIMPFFNKYIDYMELEEMYKEEKSIFDQDDLEIEVINCVREFIFNSDEQKYFIEFIIRLYKYYTK